MNAILWNALVPIDTETLVIGNRSHPPTQMRTHTHTHAELVIPTNGEYTIKQMF